MEQGAAARVAPFPGQETGAMETPLDPLSPLILTISYFGDVVFAISGALTAMRYRMDII
jgi:hypothetical protein